jgi:hypothetical protein
MLVGPPTPYFREVDRKRWSSCLRSCRARNVSRLITPSQRHTEDTSALIGLAIVARWRQRQSALCVGIPVSALTLKLFGAEAPLCPN